MATRYVLDFGTLNAGGTPTFSEFARTDTWAPVAAPTISTIDAAGLSWFDVDWSGIPVGATSIAYKAIYGGIELAGVITSVAGAGSTTPSPSATTLSLSSLITSVRQRSDMENSPFVTDGEITSYINQSAFELYDLLVQKFGDDYFVGSAPFAIATDGTSQLFPLPADLLKLVGVDLKLGASADSWVSIKQFQFAERNRFSVPNFQNFWGLTNLRYRLVGSQIMFTPMPSAGQSIRLWYVPRMAQLTAPTDALEGFSGWTEYVIVDAAIKCRVKEESDTSDLRADKAALIARIEAAADNRDAGAPQRVADSAGSDILWPGSTYPNGTTGY